MPPLAWKQNWEQTKQHFADWWNRRGLVVVAGSTPQRPPHEPVPEPRAPSSVAERFENAELRANRNHFQLAHCRFPGDRMPLSNTDIGPGSLALFCGSEPGFSEETVWFEPCMQDAAEPESLPPIRFDPDSHWWKVTETTCRAAAALARGKYLVGCPDLVENIDILSAMRGPQTLMMDMIERPSWVEQKVMEINEVFFEAYRRIYDIIRQPDGSAAFNAFHLWGPGKTAKVQCDACAMFSPDMFRRFVVPAMTEQCRWLDYSMYHLDGTACIDKLDHLLAIDELDAIEWTPEVVEGGGNPRWYEMYHRILDAGKSLQAIGVRVDELRPLLDELGADGVFAIMHAPRPGDTERALAIAEEYRP